MEGDVVIRTLGKFVLPIIAVMLIASAVCQGESVLTRHVREATRNGAAKYVGPMTATKTLRLVLTLPLRNEAELDQLLQDVYNPNSSSYRHFITVDEFTAQFGPTQDDYNAVIDFAKTHGLTVVGTSRNRLNVDVVGSVASIESAFHVKMNLYKHPTENRDFYAPANEPTVDLPFQLWHISGLDNYSIPRPAGLSKRQGAASNATTGSGPSASFLGSDMRAAYYGGTALTGAGQTVGLLEFAGTDLADVSTYYTNAHQTNNVPITLLSTDGTSTSCLYSTGCDDTEQTLDITQALGMAPGLSELTVYVGSSDASIFNAIATRLSPKTGKPDAQIGVSWAWRPADPSTDDPYFKEFALQGQNVFVAAGDYGKWPSQSSPYYYPAEDAYVTAVGGTDLQTSSAAGPWSSESAWADGGGGISPDKIAIPSWQTATASSCSNCSKTYRNAPDVSANANFTFYVCADQTTCTANAYGGTSFAAPMWAGYLALVNQQAVANSGTPLGFINPSLYTIGLGSNFDTDFHDITSGSNGYSAITGYDLATGWGSPNGAALIAALTGTSTSNGFSLSASPTSVSIAQGGSGSSTITSTVSGSFSSAVSLSASGQPTGVTVGFSPSSISGTGTSNMTINVGSSVTPGTYAITVTGTGGSTTETTTVSLTVTSSSASFTLSSSGNLSIQAGNSGQVTVSDVVSGTLSSVISLSVSGLPSNASGSFNPATLPSTGNSSSQLAISTSTSTPAGNYTVTVTGTTSNGTKATTSFTLSVTAAATGDFTISAGSPVTVKRGSSAGDTVTITAVSGFTGTVSLSASGTKRGVSVNFSPSSVTGSGNSTMTVKANKNAAAGTYTVTVTGTSGSLVHSTSVSLTVQ
jgi:kumamolisin